MAPQRPQSPRRSSRRSPRIAARKYQFIYERHARGSARTLQSVYQRHPLAEDEIRVLILEPALNFETPIRCALEVAHLDGEPDYEAISYTWGPPVTGMTLSNRLISVCGADAVITGNLYDGLKRLRLTNRPRRIWVDALCINQSNQVERTHQVANMAKVYRTATKVQAWLGEDVGDAKIALAFFKSINQCRWDLEKLLKQRRVSSDEFVERLRSTLFQSGTKLASLVDNTLVSRKMFSWPKERDQLIHFTLKNCRNAYEPPGFETAWVAPAIVLFMDRTYFKRRWILQELHHAQVAVVRCGKETMAWAELKAAYSFRITPIPSVRYFETPPVFKFDRVLSLRTQSSAIGRLLDLCHTVDLAQCEDPRDRIYALLSLVPDIGLRPDYTLSEAELLTKVAKLAFLERFPIPLVYVAACCGMRRSVLPLGQSVPSWVFDPGQWNQRMDHPSMLQSGAYVDSRDRLTCTVNCVGEVMLCNGWPLLARGIDHMTIERVKRAPPWTEERQSAVYDAPRDTFTIWHLLRRDVVQVLGEMKGRPLRAGDLFCDGPDGSIFVLRPFSARENNRVQFPQLRDCEILATTGIAYEPAAGQWLNNLTRQKMRVRIS